MPLLADNLFSPSATKMPLKAEGVGFLIKAVACGRSRNTLCIRTSHDTSGMHMMKSAACTLR